MQISLLSVFYPIPLSQVVLVFLLCWQQEFYTVVLCCPYLQSQEQHSLHISHSSQGHMKLLKQHCHSV